MTITFLDYFHNKKFAKNKLLLMGYKPHDQFADINLTTVNYTFIALICATRLRINDSSKQENIQV